ncbi:MAG: response regulator [Nitrospirae bacterium]|nr:response regulator [Nitrospirota bacterium]
MEKNKKILIVEDEAVLSMQIKYELLQMGYSITGISDTGQKALASIGAELPDIVLMDITLKGELDGIETAGLIHKQYNIPIIYMTAHSEKGTVERAKITNPYGYLLKPVNTKELQIALDVSLYKSVADKEKAELTEKLLSMTHELKRKNELLEQVNKEKEEMLVQQSKMAAMGEMIRAIAHQWKQPLNILGLVVQDIQDSYEYGELDKSQIDRSVNETLKQIDFMSNTIEDFQNFMKPDKGKQVFNVQQAAGEIFFLLSAQLKANYISYSLTCHIHNKSFRSFTEIEVCKECEITSYNNEFKQVILNLVSNSKDAILNRRGKGLMEETDEGNIIIDLYSKDNKIIIEQTDNGGGIPEEHIAKVFDTYFTTKGKGKGSGIGLYMSKVIIEQHMGGSIHASNGKNGAVFTIELPYAAD